jgi:adenylate cyclase class 2
MEEIEVKFLDISVLEVKEKLQKLGAQKIGEYLYKRKTYDYADKKLAKDNAWVRLRDEGDKVTFTYKQRFGVNDNHLQDGGVNEIEVIVSDFVLADNLLKAIGLVEKFYEENKRERYMLENTEIDIDTWPMIPTYLEIEGSSWEIVKNTAQKLGFSWETHVKCSTMQVYEKYGINENDYSVITFNEQVTK